MYNCELCDKPVPGYEPEYCCPGTAAYECGCEGRPIHPCVCSDKCWDALQKGIGKPIEERRIDAGIERYRYGIIYLLTNTVNGKKYVGQTVKPLDLRWQRHCWNCTYKNNMPVDMAIRKYGRHSFTREVIAECYSQEELNEKEKHYVNELNTWSPHGYNLRAGDGMGAMSEQVKDKIRVSNTGKIRSDETRRKLSVSHMGQIIPDYEIQRRKEFMKGKGPSEEARQKGIRNRTKTYCFLHNGEKIVIYNMAKFCRDNHLCRSKMSSVATGKKDCYRGYALSPEEETK